MASRKRTAEDAGLPDAWRPRLDLDAEVKELILLHRTAIVDTKETIRQYEVATQRVATMDDRIQKVSQLLERKKDSLGAETVTVTETETEKLVREVDALERILRSMEITRRHLLRRERDLQAQMWALPEDLPATRYSLTELLCDSHNMCTREDIEELRVLHGTYQQLITARVFLSRFTFGGTL